MKEQEQFIETSDNPAPRGGQVHWFTGHKGARLRAGLWEASGESQLGTVFLMPGKSEYVEKYFEVIGELIERGYGVVAIDWRGQGLSHRDIDHPLKAHIVRFEDFFDDFEALYGEVADNFPKPHYALAHSMGGNIALRLMAERDVPIEALVLSAPMTGIRLGRVMSQLATQVGGVMTRLGKAEEFLKGGEAYDPLTSRFEESKVTLDRRRFDRSQNILKTHPPIAQGSATYGWMHEALKSTERLFKRNYDQQIQIPVLLCLARADQLVNVESSEKLAAKMPNCRLEEFHDAEHEILMERDEVREQFWRAFDRFLSDVRS